MSSELEWRDGKEMNRRRFLKLSAAAAGGLALGVTGTHWLHRARQPRTRVAIYRAGEYTDKLVTTIREGLREFPEVLARVKGGRVILKPNLVEYDDARRVNTHPIMVAAAVEAFRSYDAADVVVAEGPGHRRDMEMLLGQSGLEQALDDVKASFVDLNLDGIAPVALGANYTKLGRLFLPRTVLGADLVVSMPKLKTHHWAGVTVALKNLFGVVPGQKYGWPKNILHWRGIHQSIMDIALAVRPGFAIVDGIEAMEGDGPLRGDTVWAGVIVMGENLTAVDATAARVMDIQPERIPYLVGLLRHGGTMHSGRIQQVGELVESVRRPFKLPPGFEVLRESAPVMDHIRGL